MVGSSDNTWVVRGAADSFQGKPKDCLPLGEPRTVGVHSRRPAGAEVIDPSVDTLCPRFRY